jgi:hypothetical protein
MPLYAYVGYYVEFLFMKVAISMFDTCVFSTTERLKAGRD